MYRLIVAGLVLFSVLALAGDSPIYLRRGGGGGTPTVSIANGGTTETASTEDAVLVGAGTTDWAAKVLVDCDAATSAVTYDTTTNAFGCNVISLSFAGLTGTASIAQGGTTETASTEDAVLVGASTTDWAPQVLPSCSGINQALQYNSTSNAFTCNTIPGFLSGRKAGQYAPIFPDPTNSTTHWQILNMTTITNLGSGGSQAGTGDSTGAFLQWNTGTTSTNANGFRFVNPMNYVWGPRIYGNARISSTADIRFWWGISNIDLSGCSDACANSRTVAFRYATDVADPAIMACKSNGADSGVVCVTTGVAASTAILALKIDCSAETNCIFSINGTVTNTLTFTPQNGGTGPTMAVTTLTNSAKGAENSGMFWDIRWP